MSPVYMFPNHRYTRSLQPLPHLIGHYREGCKEDKNEAGGITAPRLRMRGLDEMPPVRPRQSSSD